MRFVAFTFRGCSNHSVLSCPAWQEAAEYIFAEILVQALNATEHIVLPSKVWERFARRCVSVKKSLPLASCRGWAGKTPAVRLWGMVLKYCKSAALVSCAGHLGLSGVLLVTRETREGACMKNRACSKTFNGFRKSQGRPGGPARKEPRSPGKVPRRNTT